MIGRSLVHLFVKEFYPRKLTRIGQVLISLIILKVLVFVYKVGFDCFYMIEKI
jgi:hypothetical protein